MGNGLRVSVEEMPPLFNTSNGAKLGDVPHRLQSNNFVGLFTQK